MFELIGSIFSFAFGIIRMGFSLAWSVVQFVFGLLGGIFSLLVSLSGFGLIVGLVALAVHRRKADRRHQEQQSAGESRTYDVDDEEFTSFYDQFRAQE